MDMFVLGLCGCMILFGVDCDVEGAYRRKTKSLVIYHLTFLIYHFDARSVMTSKDPHYVEFTLTDEKPTTRRLTFTRRQPRGAACELCRSHNKAFAYLPRTPAGKPIAGQILRSGTSPAPNYGEARGAESRADFVHKIRVVLKELNETSIWLRIIERSGILKAELLRDIVQENGDLCKIFAASLKTARTRDQMTNEKCQMIYDQ
jgi:four helix bundle protein